MMYKILNGLDGLYLLLVFIKLLQGQMVINMVYNEYYVMCSK